MDQKTKTRPSNTKTWAIAIFVWVFLLIWLGGMTAGITASACRNDRYEGTKKLRFCNISLVAGAWSDVFPTERAKGSIIHLEKGIALSQIGRDDEALEAFERAIRDARARRGTWEQALHQRMARLEDQRALALWASVVKASE